LTSTRTAGQRASADDDLADARDLRELLLEDRGGESYMPRPATESDVSEQDQDRRVGGLTFR
jgi:hypothetical protein